MMQEYNAPSPSEPVVLHQRLYNDQGDSLELKKYMDFGFCPRVGDNVRVHGLSLASPVTSVVLCSVCANADIYLATIEVRMSDFDRTIGIFTGQGWVMVTAEAPFDQEHSEGDPE